MNYTDRKTLTEFLGECWHRIKKKDVCGCHYQCTCGGAFIYPDTADVHVVDETRTFTTPDDFFALVERLRETGKWGEFILFADRIWADDPVSVPWFVSGDESQIVPFTAWLFDPARFCELVAEWLKEER